MLPESPHYGMTDKAAIHDAVIPDWVLVYMLAVLLWSSSLLTCVGQQQKMSQVLQPL